MTAAVERDPLTHEVIGAALAVHRELGPGLLESVYEACLARELELRGVRFGRGRRLPILYRGVELSTFFRLDLVVGDRLIVELKAVEQLAPVHKAQLLTYLKLTGIRTGLLINFNVPRLTDGIVRLVR